MRRVILRGFLARKLRSALTATAIFLGVAMISGTFVLTDKINAAFTDIFRTGNEHVDVSITQKAAIGADGGSVPFDAGVVEAVEQVDGVVQAVPVAETSGFLVEESKKLTAEGGAPSILSSVVPAELTAYQPVQGEFPSASGEIAVDQQLAENEGLQVGDELQLSTATGLQPVTLSGVVKFGDVSSIGGATIVLALLEDVQHWSGLDGQATRIDVAGDGNVSDEALAQRVAQAVPSGLTVQTGAANADDQAGEVADNLSFMNYLLLAFGFVAVFVGAFIIFNTYSITVAQRTRDFGVLRTLGATGRQTLLAVLGEALLVAAIATAAGIGGGIGFASLLTWAFDLAGFGIPSVGTVVKVRTLVLALTVGLGITLIAALLPALRAMGVSPLAALRQELVARRRRGWVRPALAVVFLVIAALLIGFGLSSSGGLTARLLMLAAGALTFFIAVALAMAYFVTPVVAILGVVARRLGSEGKVATRNTTRNPERTAVTAAALMIGTALVVFVAILGSGLKASIGDSIDRSVHGDLVVSAETQGTNLPTAAVDAVRSAAGVKTVSPVGMAPVRLGASTDTTAHGIDPATLDEVYDVDWVAGSDAVLDELGQSGALVERSTAESAGLTTGDTVQVTGQTGATRSLQVLGIYEDPIVLTGVLVADGALQPLLTPGNTGVDLVYVSDDPDAAPSTVEDAVQSALQPFAVAQVQSNADIKEQAEDGINQMLTIFYALLAMSVIISLFGIVNTLVLSVYERTREIGVLRAVGTTPRQIRRMIRYESVMTAVLGTLLGVVVGSIFGFVITTALSSEGLSFAFPGAQVVLFMLLAVVAGVVAAVLPARRAARLDVLDALQHQ